MSSSRKILIGLVSGVAVGLFVGEEAAVLDWAADGFVKLLQMTVLPYVTLSIVSSLGRLDAAHASRLGMRLGAVIVSLWAIALVYAFLIPLTFPAYETANFYSIALVEPAATFDFVDLYIPANPFYSLANNIVPAVVLFSILLGVALIGVERKSVLLDVVQVAAEAVARATRFVATLTPYGLFAIAATTAGTMNVEQLVRLQIYLIAYASVALFVSLWVLPGLVGALTPISHRDVLRTARDALVTAFVAGDLFIVLPALIDVSKTLIERYGIVTSEAQRLPEVIVPASFNFPHSGKLLSISFILFAGWFADAAIAVADYPQLAVSGTITFFGSLSAAVPYLLDLFRIPADTFQLFLATGIINSRFGTLLAAVHTIAVALLGTCAVLGVLSWERRRLLRFATVTALLTVVMFGGARALFATVLVPEYGGDKVVAEMRLLYPSRPATVQGELPAADVRLAGESTLEAIRRRHRIRVGYLPDSLPYAYHNAAHELVGLDIELAHRLAAELSVELELVPVVRESLQALLNDGRCDLVMSGVVVTTDRASQQLFTASYLDDTLGFLVADHDRDRFRSWDAIGARGAITIGTLDVPYFMSQLRELLPRATFKTLHSVHEIFGPGRLDLDAVAFPAERGSAWTLLHPQYSIVVPEGVRIKVPLAYPVAQNDQAFVAFLNTWIDLKRKDGTLDALFRHWILGQNADTRQPRWSIARNVLGWMD